MRRPSPQTLAASAALTLLAAVAIVTARGEAPTYDRYASTDYRPGGFRAWGALLEREGLRTTRFVQRPVELNERIDTLISAPPPHASGGSRSLADMAALARWVRGGGRLVYIGRDLALSAPETALFELPFWLPEVGRRGAFTGTAATRIPALAGLGTNRMLFVEHAGTALLADAVGDIAVRYPLGRGEVTAVADPVPLTNAHIGSAANARFAYILAEPGRVGGRVAFDDALHGALVDRPWYRALPAALQLALSIAGIGLALALGGGALGGTPPLRLRPAREPTSAEFVAALAALYERTHARATAQALLIRAALSAAAGAAGLPASVPLDTLAERNREDAQRLRRLASGLATPAATDSELLASAQLAHRIRKDVTDGGIRAGPRAAFAGRPPTRRRR